MEAIVITGVGLVILVVTGYIVKKYVDGLVNQALSQFATFQSNMNANDKLITDTISGAIDKVATLLTPPSK